MPRSARAGRGKPARKKEGKISAPVEVYFHDSTALYDAPIDDLWEFMRDEEIHGAAHGPTLRNFEGRELSPTSFEATYEILRGGKWYWSKSRHTEFPPLCKIGEHLEGAYAGTIFLIHFWPEGERTRVEVWARLRSDVLSAKDLRAHWRESFTNAYSEDIAVLPRFMKAKRDRRAES
ncbi:MAG TPA: hypothetical protein VGV89_06045 [Thermoplasmata archaeon]|nr:hypothetical protein [Thermoplasmata archaeon]